jgi:hypothetical protein
MLLISLLLLNDARTLSSRSISLLLLLSKNYRNYLPTINASSQPTIFTDDTSVTLSSKYGDFSTTANTVNSVSSKHMVYS